MTRDCPSLDRLERLLLPGLAQAERQALEEHVGTCAACQAVLGRSAVLSSNGFSQRVREVIQRPKIPGYAVGEELGRGGMGVVYRARQITLNRLVALKVILAGAHASKDDLARFRTEAEAAARLEHLNIARVYEVREHDGLPYFTLEYVSGGTLASWRGGTPLPAKPAAELTKALAEAIHSAHQAGVVHRDLKPGNILLQPKPGIETITRVEDFDAKITDFGLAKKIDEPGETRPGVIMGTPEYMAPEQTAGAGVVGPAADVYALGAILYELLTGRPPFRGATGLETLELVRSKEPVAPGSLQPRVPRDIETICLKCLAKSLAGRYPSARGLADDLGRFIDGKPIRARPVGLGERAWKWAKRNPAVAVAAAVIITAVLGALTVSTAFYLSERQARIDEQQATRNESNARQEAVSRLIRLHTAEGERSLQAGYLLQALPDYGEALRLDPGHGEFHRTRLGCLLREAPGVELVCAHGAPVLSARLSPDGRWLLTTDAGGLARVWDVATGEPRAELRHDGPVQHGSFSTDGTRVVTASDDQTARLWWWANGRVVRLPHGEPVQRAWFATGDTKVVTAAGDFRPRMLRAWDANKGQLDGEGFPSVEWIEANKACVSPDASRVALVTWGLASKVGHTRAVVYDLRTRKTTVIDARKLIDVTDARFTPDSEWLLMAGHGRVYAWHAATGRAGRATRDAGQETIRLCPDGSATDLLGGENKLGGVRLAALSPVGSILAVTCDDARLRLCELPDGRVVSAPLDGEASMLSFSGDGRALVTVLGEPRASPPPDPFTSREVRLVSRTSHQARVWDTATGYPVSPPLTHQAPITVAELNHDGSKLLTAGEDGAVILWDLRSARESAPLLKLSGAAARGRVENVAVTSDGRVLASVQREEGAPVPEAAFRLLRWDLSSGDPAPAVVWQGPKGSRAFLSEDGRRACVASGKIVRLYETTTGALTATLEHHTEVEWAGLEHDARRALTLDEREILVWDLASGRARSWAPGTKPERAWLSPGGRHVLVATEEGKLRVRDYEHAADASPPSLRGKVEEVIFSRDGERVLILSGDSSALLYDLGRSESRVLSHSGVVRSAQFSPDGSRVATGGSDGVVRLWAAETAEPLTRPLAHAGSVGLVQFDADGGRVATVSSEEVVQVWDSAGGEIITPPVRQPGKVEALAFSASGTQLLIACRQLDDTDGFQVRCLDLSADRRPVAQLSRHAALLAGFEVDVAGNRRLLDGRRRRQLWEELKK